MTLPRKFLTFSKVQNSLAGLWSKPLRVNRLSPQGQEEYLNQRGIVTILFTIEVTIV